MADQWCDWMSPRTDRPDGPVYLFCQYTAGHEGHHSWEGRRPKGHAVAAELVEAGGDWIADPVEVELPE